MSRDRPPCSTDGPGATLPYWRRVQRASASSWQRAEEFTPGGGVPPQPSAVPPTPAPRWPSGKGFEAPRPLVARVVHPRPHRVRRHLLRRVGAQKRPELPRLLGTGVEPAPVVRGPDDHRHAAVDGAYHAVGLGGQDGARLQGLPVRPSPRRPCCAGPGGCPPVKSDAGGCSRARRAAPSCSPAWPAGGVSRSGSLMGCLAVVGGLRPPAPNDTIGRAASGRCRRCCPDRGLETVSWPRAARSRAGGPPARTGAGRCSRGRSWRGRCPGRGTAWPARSASGSGGRRRARRVRRWRR
jgi:hypothetical protein